MPKPYRYWTKDDCKRVASNYTTRSGFRRAHPNCHSAASRNGWLDEVCAHMVRGRKPNNFWTKERCAEEALKYKSRTAFKTGCQGGYTVAYKNGWLDEICTHMQSSGDFCNRFVYEIADHSQKAVYVGLTCNPNKRLKEHRSSPKGVIARHGSEYDLEMALLSELIPAVIAAQKEQFFIDKYRAMGYEILNRTNAGALGYIKIKWTKEKCAKEALKYKHRSDFCKHSHRAYDAALREGWLDDICSHMTRKIKPMGYWTDEAIMNEAKKYSSQTEFRNSAPSCFTLCQVRGLMTQACSHMVVQKKSPAGYWKDKENCRKEAMKYTKRVDFSRNAQTAYKISIRNGWIDEFFPPKTKEPAL